MRETVSTAMPPCFERWCKHFDSKLKNQAQRTEFRHYIGGLLGESERKKLTQIANSAVDVSYHSLRHFAVRAPWNEQEINEQRLMVMNRTRQTKIRNGFSLIVDDSGHRKSGATPRRRKTQGNAHQDSGNFTDAVGRQYIGAIGKVDNGISVVTTHLYDGVKSLPLDIELYEKASSLVGGKNDPSFRKKPEIALELIERTLKRGYRPGIVLLDAGYGNNSSFLENLEKFHLKYLGGIAKNRKVSVVKKGIGEPSLRVDKLAESFPQEAFSPVLQDGQKPKMLWVAVIEVEINGLEGSRSLAIAMNKPNFEEATEVDYFLTNESAEKVTPEWVVKTYSQRNWVEVFYREAKGWLGLKEYQVRHKRSLSEAFYFGDVCLHFHHLASKDRRIKKAVGKQTVEDIYRSFRGVSQRDVLSFCHNLSSGSTTTVTYSQLIKRAWAIFGLEIR